MNKLNLRSPIARARGLGSVKGGVEHWWAERVSAVALVPLTIWFAASIIAVAGRDHAAFMAWLGSPVSSVCMVLLLLTLFYHMALGLQVVIEDYVHSGAKTPLLVAMHAGCFALATAGTIATLRIALSG